MVVIINGMFSFWQEYKAEKATEALRRMLPTYAHVLRDGQECRVPAETLVPGDLMLLAEGDAISADGRLVQEFELRTDQSTLSGESNAVRKSAEPVTGAALARAELPNLVFAGTHVAAGTGRAVVFATGMQTEFGKIAELTQAIGSALSPLQKEIQVVTKVVSIFAVAAGLIFFLVSILVAGMTFVEAFIFAIGMIVAFVPEGLLPTVTLTLAMGVQRMVKRHALVKRLSAVETLGCTTVICTDKTGTLTQNEMTVRELWVNERALTVSGTGYKPIGEFRSVEGLVAPGDMDLQELLRAATLCNDARLVAPADDMGYWGIVGDPTEAALLVVAQKAQVPLAGGPRSDGALPRVREIPFESHRKRMSTIHQGRDGQLVAFAKGAPRELLALSTRIWQAGAEAPLGDALRNEIVAANDQMARAGFACWR